MRAIEEELFYPAVRTSVGKDIMNEADEEHHVEKVLIAELEGMDGRETHYEEGGDGAPQREVTRQRRPTSCGGSRVAASHGKDDSPAQASHKDTSEAEEAPGGITSVV